MKPFTPFMATIGLIISSPPEPLLRSGPVRSLSLSFVFSVYVSLALVTAYGCGEGEGESETKITENASAKRADSTDANVAPVKRRKEVRYEDSRSELKRLMRDLRVAITSENESDVVTLLASLRLSDHDEWMKRVFGPELGKTLSEEYKPQRDEIGLMAGLLKTQFDAGLTEIAVDRFLTPEVNTATGYQSSALKKMVESVPLYSVRFRSKDGKQSYHLWSFVYDGTSFRYVGKLRTAGAKNVVQGRDLSEFRIIDAARLTAP